MEIFVIKTLKRLRKESPRKFKDLRITCDELIAALTEKEKANGGESQETDADQYFEPLEMACQTRQPRLMEIALDAVHFLIEHGYMKGKKKIDVEATENIEIESETKANNYTLMDLIIETVSKCSDEIDDGVQLQVIKVLLTAITSLHCEVHEASLLLSVRACFHIHLISKNLINKTTAKAALTQMLSVINQRMEINDIKTIEEKDESQSNNVYVKQSSSEKSASLSVSDVNVDVTVLRIDSDSITTNTTGSISSLLFPSIYHKDAYLLFRALCKLSMKGLNEETQIAHVSDVIPLQNKLLSLELILHILSNIGPAFRTGDKFIYAIRTYLCVSLLSNCTSHVAQVAGLSLQLFIVLIDQFKDHLKNEIEVFVTTIFLRMLESENSTYDHKVKLLEVFHAICKDPKFQVEIFMNFDCDLESVDIFSRIVSGFSKIAKNPSLVSSTNRSVTVDFMSSINKKNQQEEYQIRSMGLEGLVIILNSISISSSLSSNFGVEVVETVNFQSTDIEDENIPSPSASISSTNVVEVFDKKQKLYEELETGILKFNLNPKNGLSYLAQSGHIEITPTSVADFLHTYQDRLDKTTIGDYLGREREYLDGFCLKVLHEYCENLDFAGMPFDLAIRHFLNGFRLPGEAQKIDRIMEKFAERYYLQNRQTFASADMAFILAFSTIMLQTNLHNPAIRDDKRMTKEQFIKQNKGISTDGELSDDLLSEIYDRIAAQPISIKEEDKSMKKKEEQPSFVIFQATTEKRKKDAFNNERKEMVKAGEALMKLNMKRHSSIFLRNTANSGDEAYARPMFEVIWPPMIGVLSQILEMYDDSEIVQLCLDGFRSCIMLSCRLDIPIARNTFINALLKFTTLDAVKEMKPKNVSCIKMLMNISLAEGDYLEESWVQVLQNVSQLARLQLLASGSHTDDIFFSDTASDVSRPITRRTSTGSDTLTKLFMGVSRAETIRATEEANAELVIKVIDAIVVDHLFLHSVHLSGESVKHFVRSLCEVSMLELTTTSSMNSLRGKDSSIDSSAPRIFSLQKLVEVADCNMFSRSRMDWSSMWSLLAKHFSTVGLHDNLNVAMYAIDSLKQLSVKFLQKEELSNFNFQRVFLTPFEHIMVKTKSSDIKFLVINCIEVMIRSCASNIHSGWRSIFTIFTCAAYQESIDIANSAFNIIYQLIKNQFELLIYDFVELINCLVSFVTSYHSSLSLAALENLSICADNLANGLINPAVNSQNPSSDTMGISWEKSKPLADVGEDASVFRLWWPLLLGLSTSVADNRLQVRVKALETILTVLKKHGKLFSHQAWSVIFKGVLFPIVDSAKTDSTLQPRSAWPSENPLPSKNIQSWIGTMGLNVLTSFVELYKTFGASNDSVLMLSDVLCILDECINQEIEVLAKMGLSVMRNLILSLEVDNNSIELPSNQIDLICKSVCDDIVRNLCLDFADAGVLSLYFEQIPDKVKSSLTRCPITNRCNFKIRSNSSDNFISNQIDESDQFIPIPWSEKSISAMTSMVLSLDFINLVRDMLHSSSYKWNLLHYELFLQSLETSHWHAFAFSENSPLRLQLQQRGFMNKNRSPNNISTFLPNLLEQEIQSMEQLLFTVFHLYCYNKHYLVIDKMQSKTFNADESERFSEAWIERLSSLVLNRYLSYEENIIRKTRNHSPIVGDPESSDDEDHFASSYSISLEDFWKQKHEAYKSPALIVLEGMMDFTHEQIQNNLTWIVPLLSRLVICEDIEVRLCVRQIYQSFINFLLIKQ